MSCFKWFDTKHHVRIITINGDIMRAKTYIAKYGEGDHSENNRKNNGRYLDNLHNNNDIMYVPPDLKRPLFKNK